MNANELIEKVKGFEDTFAKLTEQVADFRKLFENAEAGEDKRFKRVEPGETYYYISIKGGKFVVVDTNDLGAPIDKDHFNNNDYFLTKERAQEVADKLNYLMRLERLHDELCPDYVPNWQDENEEKYRVFYNYKTCKYERAWAHSIEFTSDTYFPTKEVTFEACDILNGELEQTKK